MSDFVPPMRRRADLEKIALVTCRSELEKVKAINVELLAALKLAQAWLANSVPLVHDGTPPLPVIAAALAKAEGK